MSCITDVLKRLKKIIIKIFVRIGRVVSCRSKCSDNHVSNCCVTVNKENEEVSEIESEIESNNIYL